MLNKFKNLALCLLTFCGILISCNKDLDEAQPKISSNDEIIKIENSKVPLKINIAKIYYENFSKEVNIKSKNRINSFFNRDSVNFNEAQEFESDKFSYIEAPITSSKKSAFIFINNDKDTTKYVKNNLLEHNFERLIIYKDKSSGVINERIVTFVPDKNCIGLIPKNISENNTGNISPNFTGWLVYQTWDRVSLFSIYIKNGKAIKKLRLNSSINSTKIDKTANKVLTQECGYQIVMEYEYVCYYPGIMQNPKEEVCIWDEVGEEWIWHCEDDGIEPDPTCYESGDCNDDDIPGGGDPGYYTPSPPPTNQQRLDALLEGDFRFREFWDKMNTSEKLLALQHPEAAYRVYKNAQKSLQIASQTFPGDQHNTTADAFRHALWNGLNARDMGTYLASGFGDAHENFPDNDPTEKEMDLHNNREGREATYRLEMDNEYTELNLIHELVRLAEGGGLRILYNGHIIPSS
ncbi:MAG: hypothetical protein COW65_04890 [Cytophagales bacterium CG18_big_fil_WC_8_21_14_2_50_42_9]|nr:MAG: hypothetical protein COW65_04890 [Cytophagales bacterium CG18_big_fil_WC_8_21_14_2_50_42_9]